MYVSSNHQMATDIYEDEFLSSVLRGPKSHIFTGVEDLEKMFPNHQGLPDSCDSDYFSPEVWHDASLNSGCDFLECIKYDDLEFDDWPNFFMPVSPKTFQPITSNMLDCMEPNLGMIPNMDFLTCDLSNIIVSKMKEFSDIEQMPEPDVNLLFDEDAGLSDDELLDNKDWHKDYNIPDKDSPEPEQTPQSRIISHLDFDHCYSAPPIDEPQPQDVFNSPPLSPASSSCSEVDVETIPTQTVPKLILKSSPLQTEILRKPPLKRGRKPSKFKPNKRTKTTATTQRSKNSQMRLNPKVLTEAIKKQNYITKSGRMSKISNSVETTPSSSAPSSLHSSRCSSDSEDAVDKRASHNMAERNRRQELCNLFQELRKAVPATKRNPKASKVLILNSARDFVRQIRDTEAQRSKLRHELELKMNYLHSLTAKGSSS